MKVIVVASEKDTGGFSAPSITVSRRMDGKKIKQWKNASRGLKITNKLVYKFSYSMFMLTIKKVLSVQ